MRFIISCLAILFASSAFSTVYKPVHYAITGVGKTVEIAEISYPEDMTMEVGETMEVPVTITDSNGEILTGDLNEIFKGYEMTWYTSNSSIAYVTRDGQIKAVRPGKVKLYAQSYNTPGITAEMDYLYIEEPSETEAENF